MLLFTIIQMIIKLFISLKWIRTRHDLYIDFQFHFLLLEKSGKVLQLTHKFEFKFSSAIWVFRFSIITIIYEINWRGHHTTITLIYPLFEIIIPFFFLEIISITSSPKLFWQNQNIAKRRNCKIRKIFK